jgi:AcrR family transcriptional regulator
VPPEINTERRGQIVERLMAAVGRLLESGESYTELSVERLVTEAGLSRSTFYVYFEDKGELLRALSEGLVAQLALAASQWWDQPPGASRDEIRGAMGGIVDTYRPRQVLMTAVVEASSYDARVREEFGAMLGAIVGGLAEHIRRGQAHGSINAELDPAGAAGWLVWMTERGLYNLIRHGDDAEVERYTDALTTIVWNTLYA